MHTKKRIFDLVFAIAGIITTGWLIFLLFIIAAICTGKNGFFLQKRVGRHGALFNIYKIRTMHDINGLKVVYPAGRFMRKYKLDEFPQFFNVLFGTMSAVGPRPDIEGYYDVLTGPGKDLLLLKPGMTGPASLKYANEEYLLASHPDPEDFNNNFIFPDKVRINLRYLKHWSVLLDIRIIFCTVSRRPLPERLLNL